MPIKRAKRTHYNYNTNRNSHINNNKVKQKALVFGDWGIIDEYTLTQKHYLPILTNMLTKL